MNLGANICFKLKSSVLGIGRTVCYGSGKGYTVPNELDNE